MVVASFSKMCKNGNISERNKWGKCLCKECKANRSENSSKWQKNNKEKVNEKNKKWRERAHERVVIPHMCKRGNIAERNKRGDCLCAECKEYRAAYIVKWFSKNREKKLAINRMWRNRNTEKARELTDNWRKINKGLHNSYTAKRRAAKLRQTPKWADLDKIRAFYIEADRLTQETGIKHEVDHIIPLQGEFVSGLHVHQNLQILTQSENRSKSNKLEILPSEYQKN